MKLRHPSIGEVISTYRVIGPVEMRPIGKKAILKPYVPIQCECGATRNLELGLFHSKTHNVVCKVCLLPYRENLQGRKDEL